MNTMANRVRRALQDAARPLRATEIIDALDETVERSSVCRELGKLVRETVVLRHHNPDGLTYSLRKVSPPPLRPPTLRSTPADTTAVRVPMRPPRTGSTQERVLRMLAGKRMTCVALAEASHGSLTPKRVAYALQELRRGGWVQGDHHKPVEWTHVAAPPVTIELAVTTTVADASRQSLRALIAAAQHQLDSAAELLARAKLALDADDDELPPCVGERMRDITDDIRRNGVEE